MRSVRTTALVLTVAVVGACTSAPAPGTAPAVAPTTGPSTAAPPPAASSGPSAATALASAASSPEPTPPASALPPKAPFQYADVLSVEANGIPVHVGPSTNSESILGIRNGVAASPLVLGRGDYVSVYLGPLFVEDEEWYLVWPAEGGRLGYSLTSWRPAGEDGGSNPGWVQASENGKRRFDLFHRASPDELLSLDRMIAGAGDADYVSPPQPRHDLFGLHWAVAAKGGDCRFAIRLVPVGGPDPVLAVEALTGSVAYGPLSGPEAVVHTDWPMDESDWDSFTVELASGCPWTFALVPFGHD
jgi:hypothetical protein